MLLLLVGFIWRLANWCITATYLSCCDAPQGILGNLTRKVRTSHLRCILAKVGGSGRREFTSGDLVPTWSDVNLRIGFVLWQRLMTCHKNARTQEQASPHIEKRPQSHIRITGSSHCLFDATSLTTCWVLAVGYCIVLFL